VSVDWRQEIKAIGEHMGPCGGQVVVTCGLRRQHMQVTLSRFKATAIGNLVGGKINENHHAGFSAEHLDCVSHSRV
jgi:hypothetical protein